MGLYYPRFLTPLADYYANNNQPSVNPPYPVLNHTWKNFLDESTQNGFAKQNNLGQVRLFPQNGASKFNIFVKTLSYETSILPYNLGELTNPKTQQTLNSFLATINKFWPLTDSKNKPTFKLLLLSDKNKPVQFHPPAGVPEDFQYTTALLEYFSYLNTQPFFPREGLADFKTHLTTTLDFTDKEAETILDLTSTPLFVSCFFEENPTETAKRFLKQDKIYWTAGKQTVCLGTVYVCGGLLAGSFYQNSPELLPIGAVSGVALVGWQFLVHPRIRTWSIKRKTRSIGLTDFGKQMLKELDAWDRFKRNKDAVSDYDPDVVNS